MGNCFKNRGGSSLLFGTHAHDLPTLTGTQTSVRLCVLCKHCCAWLLHIQQSPQRNHLAYRVLPELYCCSDMIRVSLAQHCCFAFVVIQLSSALILTSVNNCAFTRQHCLSDCRTTVAAACGDGCLMCHKTARPKKCTIIIGAHKKKVLNFYHATIEHQVQCCCATT